jgi:hypothetical protein
LGLEGPLEVVELRKEVEKIGTSGDLAIGKTKPHHGEETRLPQIGADGRRSGEQVNG